MLKLCVYILVVSLNGPVTECVIKHFDKNVFADNSSSTPFQSASDLSTSDIVFNRFEHPAYKSGEERLVSEDVKLKDEYTVQTYMSLIFQLLLFAQDLASDTFHENSPVEKQYIEKKAMKRVEDLADQFEADIPLSLRLYEDIIEGMRIIQYSLLSDWHAKKYVDGVRPVKRPQKYYKETHEHILRYEDYIVTSTMALDRIIEDKKCMKLAAKLLPLQKKRIENFNSTIYRIALTRSLFRFCEHFNANPSSEEKVYDGMPFVKKLMKKKQKKKEKSSSSNSYEDLTPSVSSFSKSIFDDYGKRVRDFIPEE